MRIALLNTATAFLLAFALQANAASITPLGTFPGEDQLENHALNLSRNGKFVVGLGLELNDDLSSPPPAFENVGFIWSADGGAQQIGTIKQEAYPTGVSNDGKTVSVHFIPDNSESFTDAGVWRESSGVASLPGAVPSFGKRARDISSDGSIVVGSAPNTEQGYDEAKIWTGSGITGLGVLPGSNSFTSGDSVSGNGKLVVGASSSGLFIWDAIGGLKILDPRGSSNHASISANGNYVAASVEQFSKGRLWEVESPNNPMDFFIEGQLIDIRSVDDGGTVIGNSSSNGISQAFVWRKHTGIVDIQELLVNGHGMESELEGWDLDGDFGSVEDISADGKTIIGNGINPMGEREAWVIRLDRPLLVPEPTSFTIVILGTTVLTVMRRLTASLRVTQ